MENNSGKIEGNDFILEATVEQSDGVMDIVEGKDKQKNEKEISVMNKEEEDPLEEDGTYKQSIMETKGMENEGKTDFQTITEIRRIEVITHVHMQEDTAQVDNVKLNQSTEVIDVTQTEDSSHGGKVIVDIANHVYYDITQENISIEESVDVDEVTEIEKNFENCSQALVNKRELKVIQEHTVNIDVNNPTTTSLEGFNEEFSAMKERTKVDAVNLIINKEKESEIIKDLNDPKHDIVEERDINANLIDIKEDDDCLNSNINILEDIKNMTEKEIDQIFLTEQMEESTIDNTDVNKNKNYIIAIIDDTILKETITKDNITSIEKLEPVERELTVLTPGSLSSESKKIKQSDMPIVAIDKTKVNIQELNENIGTVNIDIVEKNKSITVESCSEKISDKVEASIKPIPKVEIPSPKKVEELPKKEQLKIDNTLDQPKEVPMRKKQTKENVKQDEGLINEPQIPKLVKVHVQEMLDKEDNIDSRITSLYVPDWQPPKQNVLKYMCGCFLKPSGPN